MKTFIPKIIILLGPTASGKSDMAIKLAKKFNGEIVNADSRNVYKRMFIGTASPFAPFVEAKPRRTLQVRRKVGPKEGGLASMVSGVKHHLFHFKEPWESYSVSQYKQDAIHVIDDILHRGKLPILVGGTGLYIWAMVDNLEIPEVPPNLNIRKKLEAVITGARTSCCACGRSLGSKKKGLAHIWTDLIRLDPDAANFVQKDNPRRVIRALEVILLANKSPKRVLRLRQRLGLDTTSIIKFSDLRRQGPPLYNILQIGLKIPRLELYTRIEQRVDKQIKDGLIKETQRLLKKISYSNVLKNIRITNIWSLPSITSLGYRQIGMYLRGELELSEAIRILKRDTRRYARRQITWFKRDKRIKWLNVNKIILQVRNFLRKK